MSFEHSIQSAARSSGLSAHVIRTWEKRYRAVSPQRTVSNRRRYSEADVIRLRLLREATSSGHRIGEIAHLSSEQLGTLLPSRRPAASGIARPVPSVEQAILAARKFDHPAFEAILEAGSLRYGQHGCLEKLIRPLAHRIGDLWASGELTAAHEHFASNTIREFLLRSSRPYADESAAPRLIATTPIGQLHELGSAMVTSAARDAGWNVLYLGTSLPAAEIAAAAVQHGVRLVALSVVYPGDDPGLPGELRQLRKLLPAEIEIVIGGRAADQYSRVLAEIGAVLIDTLEELRAYLGSVRARSSA